MTKKERRYRIDKIKECIKTGETPTEIEISCVTKVCLKTAKEDLKIANWELENGI